MKRLGEILLDWGVIAVSELHTGLEACRRSGGRLGTQLLKFGFVDENSLLEALSEQYGVPAVSGRVLERAPLEVRSMIPPRVARRLQAVPFARTPEGLRVAMTNPRDPASIEEISEVTGCSIERFVSSESAILAVISESDHDFVEVVTRGEPEPRAEPVMAAFDWEQLWTPPQPQPERLLRITRRRPAPLDNVLVATFPGLAPVAEEAGREADHEIDEVTFRRRLAEVEHRDEVGRLLLRYAAHYFGRLCLFAVHRGVVVGWMARGHGVAVDDVQSFELPLDRPALFSESLHGSDRYIGPIPIGRDNDALVRVMGEPRPAAVLLLPIRVKDHTVAFLIGDTPGEDTVAVPVEELVAAARKAGAALEVLIIRKKILA